MNSDSSGSDAGAIASDVERQDLGKPVGDRHSSVRRSDSRERALELIYEAECKSLRMSAVLASLPFAPDAFSADLAKGVDANYEQHLELIRRYARPDWPPERMPVLDRLVLCIGIEELVNHPATPKAVVIDEAVELSKRFSTEDSHKFVNGMLTSIAAHLGR